jgi:hypothetical protein
MCAMFQGRFRCRSSAVRCFAAASNPPDRRAIGSVSLDRLRLLLALFARSRSRKKSFGYEGTSGPDGMCAILPRMSYLACNLTAAAN